jgi:glucokinase
MKTLYRNIVPCSSSSIAYLPEVAPELSVNAARGGAARFDGPCRHRTTGLRGCDPMRNADAAWHTRRMESARSPHELARDEWIVADIGGTHARFDRWAAQRGLIAGSSARYHNDDFADLAALINRYRRDARTEAARALLALALPVGAGAMRMTNRDWVFTADGLRVDAGLDCLWLVNDFVAAAAGVGALSDKEYTQVGGLSGDGGPKVILGPGTGLGAAVILGEKGGRERVIASEAGHMGAAASGGLAQAVCERVRVRHGRASWERLLCGEGLALFDAVAHGAEVPADPADVAARALAGDAAALRAATAFALALGEFAGDLCLALRATGGVYLVGGVLQGLGRALDANALRAGFEDKGRFGPMLRGVPCFLVHADDLAARGLARLLAGDVRAPVFETATTDHETADIRS